MKPQILAVQNSGPQLVRKLKRHGHTLPASDRTPTLSLSLTPDRFRPFFCFQSTSPGNPMPEGLNPKMGKILTKGEYFNEDKRETKSGNEEKMKEDKCYVYIGSRSFQPQSTLEKLPTRLCRTLWVSQVILGRNAQLQ